ncbi:MAG TPA: hypothetical protein VFZ70_08610 [Euzebyales bacterium]
MRRVALALAWLVATVAATALAWAGVRAVATDVAAPLPAVVTSPPAEQSVDPPPQDAPSDAPMTTSRTRTFETVGGTATVRFSPDEVEVLGAVPAAGFTADVEAEDDGSTRVDFESEHHRSRLKVWWRDGSRHEVEEQGRDGGDERQDTDDDED